MTDRMRDELIFCVGRLKGILSLVEFDDGDEDGAVVQERINEVVSDMELTLRGVDDLKGGDAK